MNIEGFINALPIMGEGMLGVFIVILVVWLCIAGMTKIFGDKK